MPTQPDPARIRDALFTQADLVAGWLAGLDDAEWKAPSILPDWSVTVLSGHLVGVLRNLPLIRPTAEPARSLAEHFPPESATPLDTDRVEELATWGAATPADMLADYAAAVAAARDTLTSTPLTGNVAVGRGSAALADLLRTRVWEFVVHADDLGRSLPDRPAPELDPGAVRIAARGFGDLLAGRVPGRSVELRVPPYFAIQCIPGPRHTRGTPPNVVETDPITWVRLACGRVRWADQVAAGTVRASGDRSDLSGYLPLLG